MLNDCSNVMTEGYSELRYFLIARIENWVFLIEPVVDFYQLIEVICKQSRAFLFTCMDNLILVVTCFFYEISFFWVEAFGLGVAFDCAIFTNN